MEIKRTCFELTSKLQFKLSQQRQEENIKGKEKLKNIKLHTVKKQIKWSIRVSVRGQFIKSLSEGCE